MKITFYGIASKETKNTVVFQEVDKDGDVVDPRAAVVPTLYVKKSKLTWPYPKAVSVTMEFSDN